jgi:hypothetical protein
MQMRFAALASGVFLLFAAVASAEVKPAALFNTDAWDALEKIAEEFTGQ